MRVTLAVWGLIVLTGIVTVVLWPILVAASVFVAVKYRVPLTEARHAVNMWLLLKTF